MLSLVPSPGLEVPEDQVICVASPVGVVVPNNAPVGGVNASVGVPPIPPVSVPQMHLVVFLPLFLPVFQFQTMLLVVGGVPPFVSAGVPNNASGGVPPFAPEHCL
jgi:hypothetical protein